MHVRRQIQAGVCRVKARPAGEGPLETLRSNVLRNIPVNKNREEAVPAAREQIQEVDCALTGNAIILKKNVSRTCLQWQCCLKPGKCTMAMTGVARFPKDGSKVKQQSAVGCVQTCPTSGKAPWLTRGTQKRDLHFRAQDSRTSAWIGKRRCLRASLTAAVSHTQPRSLDRGSAAP